ncbi:MAG TPA: thioredoxin family protein [Ktedonobacterales bacterium]|nr:thioredoxin family protein [Ktedonobacterales bacterium]
MAVSRERFEQGMTYEQYKEQMTRNQERFAANERELMLAPADLAAFQSLPRPLHVLVIAEDWCGDVIDNLPILGRIAQESGKLDLRVFLRDQNLDLIDQYLKEGQFRSIPVFVFFDDAFNEIGRFIERTEVVTERRAQARRELYAQHPEFGSPETPISQLPEDVRVKLMEELAAQRNTTRAADSQETVRALREIVSGVPA